MNGSIKEYVEYNICNLNNKFDKFRNTNFKGEIGPQVNILLTMVKE